MPIGDPPARIGARCNPPPDHPATRPADPQRRHNAPDRIRLPGRTGFLRRHVLTRPGSRGISPVVGAADLLTTAGATGVTTRAIRDVHHPTSDGFATLHGATRAGGPAMSGRAEIESELRAAVAE